MNKKCAECGEDFSCQNDILCWCADFPKLSKNEILECACVGSTFNVPISKLTITENLLMIFMAIIMILYSI